MRNYFKTKAHETFPYITQFLKFATKYTLENYYFPTHKTDNLSFQPPILRPDVLCLPSSLGGQCERRGDPKWGQQQAQQEGQQGGEEPGLSGQWNIFYTEKIIISVNRLTILLHR